MGDASGTEVAGVATGGLMERGTPAQGARRRWGRIGPPPSLVQLAYVFEMRPQRRLLEAEIDERRKVWEGGGEGRQGMRGVNGSRTFLAKVRPFERALVHWFISERVNHVNK